VARELLSARHLVPGIGSVSGLVEISNLTGAPLSARPRVRSLRGAVPEALRIEVTSGGRTLYSGKLNDLRARVRPRARAAARVRLRISAPSGAEREVHGRAMDLSLRWITGGEGR